jgi:hypothetical protein
MNYLPIDFSGIIAHVWDQGRIEAHLIAAQVAHLRFLLK